MLEYPCINQARTLRRSVIVNLCDDLCCLCRMRKDPLDPIDNGTKVALAFRRVTNPKVLQGWLHATLHVHARCSAAAR
jgi:hypothetical protein